MEKINYNPDKKWLVHSPEKDIYVKDLCIIVEITSESKPYYSIRYINEEDNITYIGWSSYKLEIVLNYLKDYFEEITDSKF